MPVLVVSRLARRGFIDHDQLDTTSLTKWVEWNHRLPALGVWGNRDVTAGNLAGAFRFGEDNGGDGGGNDESNNQINNS
jgi:hypothetical protein